ncbi:MAG: F0F1 ATP synthase subunit A [Algisphaera sp.]
MLFSPLLLASGAKLDPMSHVLPHFPFGGTWFTNHHFMSLIVLGGGVLLLLLLSKAMPSPNAKNAEDFVTKGRIPQLFETLCVFIRDEVTRPLLGDLTDKYIPYIWSTFFFILFANLLGLLPVGPIFGLLGIPGLAHAWGTMTGNINFTAGIAIIAFFMMIFVGLKENGMGFIKHMWPVPVTAPEGVTGGILIIVMPILWVAGLIVFILEAVGYGIKAFALCVRLFANMVAGHLVLGSLIIMAVTSHGILGKGASMLGATAFMFMELFVSFLQAYIFTLLVVIFMSLGAISHDEHDEHNAGLDEGELPGDAASGGLTGTVTTAH